MQGEGIITLLSAPTTSFVTAEVPIYHKLIEKFRHEAAECMRAEKEVKKFQVEGKTQRNEDEMRRSDAAVRRSNEAVQRRGAAVQEVVVVLSSSSTPFLRM